MDANISGGTPKYFVYDVGGQTDLSGGKKADKFFIGSKIGLVNIEGELKAAVIFERIPVKNLSAINPDKRREAKRAASEGVQNFKRMLESFGMKTLTAERLTNISLISEKRLGSRNALDLQHFEETAIAKLTIPVIVSAANNDQRIQQPAEIVKERTAKQATRTRPVPPSGKSQGAKPLPNPPTIKARSKPPAKPLPPVPPRTQQAPKGGQANQASTTLRPNDDAEQ